MKSSVIHPMLATLSEQPFSSTDWTFEPKLDGIRCLAYRTNGKVRLYSRNHLILNFQYPEIVRALEAQPLQNFIADGEIVAFTPGTRVTNFSQLQQRMNVQEGKTFEKSVPVFYHLFDLVSFDANDLRKRPLLERKRLLKKAFAFKGRLRYVSPSKENGLDLYKQACRFGWEGVIAKRANSLYHEGRSKEWLKFKCVKEQEFVIGGYSAPAGSREHFGALLVGYYENGQLRYAGKVGSGYTQETLALLNRAFLSVQTDESPFGGDEVPRHGTRWLKPTLVAQIRFNEWTPDGKLRHPRFLGLRNDKPARGVTREIPPR